MSKEFKNIIQNEIERACFERKEIKHIFGSPGLVDFLVKRVPRYVSNKLLYYEKKKFTTSNDVFFDELIKCLVGMHSSTVIPVSMTLNAFDPQKAQNPRQFLKNWPLNEDHLSLFEYALTRILEPYAWRIECKKNNNGTYVKVLGEREFIWDSDKQLLEHESDKSFDKQLPPKRPKHEHRDGPDKSQLKESDPVLRKVLENERKKKHQVLLKKLNQVIENLSAELPSCHFRKLYYVAWGFIFQPSKPDIDEDFQMIQESEPGILGEKLIYEFKRKFGEDKLRELCDESCAGCPSEDEIIECLVNQGKTFLENRYRLWVHDSSVLFQIKDILNDVSNASSAETSDKIEEAKPSVKQKHSTFQAICKSEVAPSDISSFFETVSKEMRECGIDDWCIWTIEQYYILKRQFRKKSFLYKEIKEAYSRMGHVCEMKDVERYDRKIEKKFRGSKELQALYKLI